MVQSKCLTAHSTDFPKLPMVFVRKVYDKIAHLPTINTPIKLNVLTGDRKKTFSVSFTRPANKLYI